MVGALFIISGAIVLWLGHLKRLDSSQ